MIKQYTMAEMCAAGCTSRRGVRFWEQQGLLGEVGRSAGDTRWYTAEQIHRAKIIAAAQFGGWELSEAKQMLEEWGPDVRAGLIARLADQAKAAAKLVENLPSCAKLSEIETQEEFDL
jgi:DNA-binding transcriptional MerR regulator